MAAKALPSQEVLRQLLDYNPDTGVLTWKRRGPEWFVAGKRTPSYTARWWNDCNAGNLAFTTNKPSGHKCGSLFGKSVLAHRVIWKMVHGSDAVGIDHIDGDPANNALSNLRAVEQAENCRNAAQRKDNSTGVTGVYQVHKANNWHARIYVDKKQVHLGCFEKFEDAVQARKAAEAQYNYHPNHGRKSA